MTYRGIEFSFFWSFHVRTDIKIDISIPIKPMTTKFGKQVHLEVHLDSNETNKAGAYDVITPRSRDKLKTLYLHYPSVYSHPSWQDGNLPWCSSDHRVTWLFDNVVLWDYVTNQHRYISTTTVHLATKLRRVVSNFEGFLLIVLLDPHLMLPDNKTN